MEQTFKLNQMKKILFALSFILTLSASGLAQSQYYTLSNRIILSGVVNQDTFLIENVKNIVTLNGELSLLKVEYNNQDARNVSTLFDDYNRSRGDIEIIFWNEYAWLEDNLKTSQPFVSLTDEIYVSLNGEEILVPVNIKFTRVRSGQGFTSFIEITGEFAADALKFDFPDFDFKENVSFTIQLTAQVRN